MTKAMNAAADTASSIIAGKIPMHIPAPATLAAAQHGHPEAIDGYILAYYYAALTNVFCQVCLPPIQQVDNNNVVKAIIDASYGDFYVLDSWLGALDSNEIRARQNSLLYQDVRDSWKHRVKDWAMISKETRRSASS